MKIDGALVIFVKTPGLTPAKTRLAAEIGKELASEFYKRAIAAVTATAKDLKNKLPDLQIYWAVAETEGLAAEVWSDFATLPQGHGSLGERLSFLYELTSQKHPFTCFMGSDSPHLTPNDLYSGIIETAKNHERKFILGETLDGGFYFFGGSIPVPHSLWQSVEYSSTKTSTQLKSYLAEFGEIHSIPINFDIDIFEDLKIYSDEAWLKNDLLPEQINLIQWSRLMVLSKNNKRGP